MTGTARTVRIGRPREGGRPATGPAGEFRPNRFATARAQRLFLLFALLLVVIYGAFAALTLSNPLPGVRENPFAWLSFSGLAAVLGVWGWRITLGRAPRGVTVRPDGWWIHERGGRRTTVPGSALREPRVAQHYLPGWSAPGPTALVELPTERGVRAYLLDEELLELARPPAV